MLAALAVCPLSARGEPLKPEVLRRAKRATVLVVTAHQGRAGSYVTTGTGFFVHPQGYLVTNAHVVGDSRLVRVVLHSGLPERRALTAQVVKVDRATENGIDFTKEEPPAWNHVGEGGDPRETPRRPPTRGSPSPREPTPSRPPACGRSASRSA